jgi:N-carbamoylputrescine amidase
MLQPAAAGRPNPFKPGDIQCFDRMVQRSAAAYSRALGVPVVLANRTGPLHTPLPIGNGELNSSFPGYSRIIDSDGTVKAKLGHQEGAIVAEVQLDPSRKIKRKPRRYGKMWAFTVPWYAFIWPQTQEQGEQAYQANLQRKQRALAISRGRV